MDIKMDRHNKYGGMRYGTGQDTKTRGRPTVPSTWSITFFFFLFASFLAPCKGVGSAFVQAAAALSCPLERTHQAGQGPGVLGTG